MAGDPSKKEQKEGKMRDRPRSEPSPPTPPLNLPIGQQGLKQKDTDN